MALITRTLLDRDRPGLTVMVSIDPPVPVNGDWSCTYRIEGMGIEECANGVDALQALLLAVESTRRLIDQSGRTLTWAIDGQPAADIGDPGIPKQVPTIVDRAERARINGMIDDAVQRWLEARAGKSRTVGRDPDGDE